MSRSQNIDFKGYLCNVKSLVFERKKKGQIDGYHTSDFRL